MIRDVLPESVTANLVVISCLMEHDEALLVDSVAKSLFCS